MAKKVQIINQFGDHACPYCKCMIIESVETKVKAGKVKCKVCGKDYTIGQNAAKEANANKERYAKACGKVKKEVDKERGTK